MKSLLPLIALALVAGASVPLQATLNAKLAQRLGGALVAGVAVFAVALLGLGALALTTGASRPTLTQLKATPHHAWLGGILGALYILLLMWLVPRLGIALTAGTVVLGQITMGLALEHFGAFGAPLHAVTLTKLLGLAAIAVGVLLIRRA